MCQVGILTGTRKIYYEELLISRRCLTNKCGKKQTNKKKHKKEKKRTLGEKG